MILSFGQNNITNLLHILFIGFVIIHISTHTDAERWESCKSCKKKRPLNNLKPKRKSQEDTPLSYASKDTTWGAIRTGIILPTSKGWSQTRNPLINGLSNVDGLSQEPLHLPCPGLDGHIKHFLAEFHHQTTKDARVDLQPTNITTTSNVSFIQLTTPITANNSNPLQHNQHTLAQIKWNCTFCSSLTFLPSPSISCSVSFSSFSSWGGRGWFTSLSWIKQCDFQELYPPNKQHHLHF